ncbi:MAG: matrixin family metalloprotease [Labilithrix sp.]|nr:matrixin family metalloprotease [Labilithrix sp.]
MVYSRRATLVVAGLAVALSTHASAAHAYEVKRTTAGDVVRWSRPSVEWHVDASMQSIDGGERAVVAALEAWSERSGAPALVVASLHAELEPGFDGKNGVFFAPDGLGGEALAVTILTFDDRTGAILDADIVLNGRYRFSAIDDVSPAASGQDRPHDLARAMAHEVGHALGLADEPRYEASLMYPVAARAARSTPAKDDLQGLRVIYRSRQDDAADPGCHVGSPRSGASGVAPWIGVAALAIVRAIRATTPRRRSRTTDANR